MDKIKIEFPPLEANKQESIDILLKTIEELMNVSIKTQKVVITQIEFDANRSDVTSTIRRIVQTLKSQVADQGYLFYRSLGEVAGSQPTPEGAGITLHPWRRQRQGPLRQVSPAEVPAESGEH